MSRSAFFNASSSGELKPCVRPTVCSEMQHYFVLIRHRGEPIYCVMQCCEIITAPQLCDARRRDAKVRRKWFVLREFCWNSAQITWACWLEEGWGRRRQRPRVDLGPWYLDGWALWHIDTRIHTPGLWRRTMAGKRFQKDWLVLTSPLGFSRNLSLNPNQNPFIRYAQKVHGICFGDRTKRSNQ